MRALLLAICTLGTFAWGVAPVPLTLPTVNVTQDAAPSSGLLATPTAPLTFAVAQQLRIQPGRLEVQIQPGYSTGTLTFTLLSEVNTQVTLQVEDARLVLREGRTPLRLLAYQPQSVSALALAPHSSFFRVINSQGAVIARVPYTVLSPKTVNQSVYFNYTPTGKAASLSYGISGVQQTPRDPRWSASVNMGIDTSTSKLSGGVSVGISW